MSILRLMTWILIASLSVPHAVSVAWAEGDKPGKKASKAAESKDDDDEESGGVEASCPFQAGGKTFSELKQQILSNDSKAKGPGCPKYFDAGLGSNNNQGSATESGSASEDESGAATKSATNPIQALEKMDFAAKQLGLGSSSDRAAAVTNAEDPQGGTEDTQNQTAGGTNGNGSTDWANEQLHPRENQADLSKNRPLTGLLADFSTNLAIAMADLEPGNDCLTETSKVALEQALVLRAQAFMPKLTGDPLLGSALGGMVSLLGTLLFRNATPKDVKNGKAIAKIDDSRHAACQYYRAFAYSGGGCEYKLDRKPPIDPTCLVPTSGLLSSSMRLESGLQAVMTKFGVAVKPADSEEGDESTKPKAKPIARDVVDQVGNLFQMPFPEPMASTSGSSAQLGKKVPFVDLLKEMQVYYGGEGAKKSHGAEIAADLKKVLDAYQGYAVASGAPMPNPTPTATQAAGKKPTKTKKGEKAAPSEASAKVAPKGKKTSEDDGDDEDTKPESGTPVAGKDAKKPSKGKEPDQEPGKKSDKDSDEEPIEAPKLSRAELAKVLLETIYQLPPEADLVLPRSGDAVPALTQLIDRYWKDRLGKGAESPLEGLVRMDASKATLKAYDKIYQIASSWLGTYGNVLQAGGSAVGDQTFTQLLLSKRKEVLKFVDQSMQAYHSQKEKKLQAPSVKEKTVCEAFSQAVKACVLLQGAYYFGEGKARVGDARVKRDGKKNEIDYDAVDSIFPAGNGGDRGLQPYSKECAQMNDALAASSKGSPGLDFFKTEAGSSCQGNSSSNASATSSIECGHRYHTWQCELNRPGQVEAIQQRIAAQMEPQCLNSH